MKAALGAPTAFFLPAEPGRRFCIFHAPEGVAPCGGILYVHPFCEEMNKARRMAALQSRRLAAAGYGVLQIDLFGCGDSSGDFSEARWDIWKSDVRAAAAWLAGRVEGRPLVLWGLRLGATLAADVARDPACAGSLLLWQPVLNGEQFLVQFLRLRLAAEMLTGGASRTAVSDLRAELARGATLEIAGYELNSALATAIEGLRLDRLVPAVRAAQWLEIGAPPDPKVSPASRPVLEAWQAGGVDVRSAAVPGEPFWSTMEITECEPLLAATTGALAPG